MACIHTSALYNEEVRSEAAEIAVFSTVMEDSCEEGCPAMKNLKKVVQSVSSVDAGLKQKTVRRINIRKCLGSPTVRMITLSTLLMGLFCLGGCLQSEKKPTRLEMTLESQALQMAALSDRLARCEHQWQTNAEEFMRYNQVAMRDIEVFHQEQLRLRASIHSMDERWTVQNDYLRNRQGHFQQGLADLNKAVKATDGRVMTVNNSLKEKIEDTHQELSHELDQLARTSTVCNRQIGQLQTQADSIAMDVNEVQQQQHAMQKLMAEDNQAIVGHLTSVTQNQSQFQDTLDDTRTSTHLAVEQLQEVDQKQDQLVLWTQTHSQRIAQIDHSATDRHETLTTEVRQMQQLTGTVQKRLGDSQRRLSQQSTKRFDRLESQHEQLIDLTQQNKQRLERLQESTTTQHTSLENRILDVADTSKNVSVQAHRADQSVTQQLNGLDQQIADLSEKQNQWQAEHSAEAGRRHASLVDHFQKTHGQHDQFQQQLTQVTADQAKRAQRDREQRRHWNQDQAAQSAQATDQRELLKQQHTELLDAVRQQQQQIAGLRESTQSQGQSLVERTTSLEALHHTLLAQIRNVDQSQARLLKDIRQGQAVTTQSIKERSQDLQAQLNILTQMLTGLENRLKETTSELEKSLKTGIQIDHAASRRFQNELTGLGQTVGKINSIQQAVQQQLERLQTTVKEQHRREVGDLALIKQQVTVKKPTNTKAAKPVTSAEK